MPHCNCGFSGDAESVASLTGIRSNLLPYWLGRVPRSRAGTASIGRGGQAGAHYGEHGDQMARRVFEQQAMALGRLFTIAANFTDPTRTSSAAAWSRPRRSSGTGSCDRRRPTRMLREEQRRLAKFALVPDLDMAGARGAAIAAWPRCAACPSSHCPSRPAPALDARALLPRRSPARAAEAG